MTQKENSSSVPTDQPSGCSLRNLRTNILATRRRTMPLLCLDALYKAQMNNEFFMLSGIPVPPSSNGQYASLFRGGKIVRVPSKEFADYKKAWAQWVKFNRESITEAKNSLLAWNSSIEVSMLLALDWERLVTKRGTMKKLDITNRSKILHDLLGETLLIDDSLFVRTPMEKCVAVDVEQVILIMRPFKLRNLAKIPLVPGFQ